MGNIIDYVCDICNYSTYKKYNMLKHRKSKKHIEKVIIADKYIGNENFAPKCAVLRQSAPKVHYNCTECQKEFVTKRNLTRHLLSIHGIDNRKFTRKKSQNSTKIMDNNQVITSEKPQFSSEKPQFSSKSSKIKSITCDFCLKSFSRLDNLNRHLKSCKKKSKFEQEQIDYKKKCNEKDQIIADLSKANSKLSTTAANQSKVIKSGIKYIKSNFINAPPLITDKNSIKMIEDYSDKIEKTISMLLYKYNHKQLDCYIRDIIVKIYIKDDKKMQSIWNTDTSRLKYLIRGKYKNKQHWLDDTNGNQIIEIVIKPILNKIFELMKDYMLSKYNLFPNDFLAEAESRGIAAECVKSIRDDKIYEQRVLQLIAHYFKLSDRMLVDK